MLPQPGPNVIFKELSEGGVLFNTGQEVYYGLNEVGCLVWKLLLQSTSDLATLCNDVHARYPDAPVDTIRSDVTELIDELVGFGLLTPREATDERVVAPLSTS